MTGGVPGKDFMSCVLSGKLNDVAKIPSKVVKIYVGSNYTDFDPERQRLLCEALAELQQCCVRHGLDCILVDPHYGAQVDHTINRSTLDAHLAELENCYHTSQGPFFLGVLGNKYGPCPLPAYLEMKEFEHIRTEAFDGGKDVKFLDAWYKKDNNAVPSVYSLQPASSKFPSFNNYPNVSDDDLTRWSDTYHSLSDLLQYGASVAHKEGFINIIHQYKQDRFFESSLAQEINRALELSPTRCVCILRTFTDIGADKQLASSYLDLQSNGSPNEEKQEKLQTLREVIASKLNEANRHSFSVTWKQGLSPKDNQDDYEYIDGLNKAVVSKLTHLIEDRTKNDIDIKYPLEGNNRIFWECLINRAHCSKLVKSFVSSGFTDLLEKIKALLISGSRVDHQAVVVCGCPGTGKTHLMARASHMVPDVLGKDTIIITRFVDLFIPPMTGKVPMISANLPISSVTTLCYHLESISKQISYVLNAKLDIATQEKDKLGDSFQCLLKYLSRTSKQLVIILDGLSDNFNVTRLNELFNGCLGTKLPPRVHVIVSLSVQAKDTDNVESFLQKRGFQSTLLWNLEMESETKREYLMELLKRNKRVVTEEQVASIMGTMERNTPSLPFALHLLAEDAVHWRSDHEPNGSDMMSNTIVDMVHARFESIEKRYSPEVTSHMCRYLSLAHHGLSEMELLDMMSLNNKVILTCFPGQLPRVFRFPHTIWSQMKRDLGSLITHHFADNKWLLKWSHPDVVRVAKQRYLQHADQNCQTHTDLAQLFLETWIDNKPLVDKNRSISLIDEGHRVLGPQPLLYNKTRYNMRRLNELWYHLLHGGDFKSFRDFAYCNFEYLLATAHANGIHSLVSNLEMTTVYLLDIEVSLVLQCIKQSLVILEHDPLQLANELIGWLRQFKDYYQTQIDSLVTQCMQWCDSYSLPILVPLTSWLPDIRTPILGSINIAEGITVMCVSRNGQHVFCGTIKNDICMYHVPSRKLVSRLSGHAGRVKCMRLSHDNHQVISGSDDGTVKVWDITKKENIHTFREHRGPVLCIALSQKDDLIISGSTDCTIVIASIEVGDKLHTLKEHTKPVTALALNSTDTILSSASEDCQVILWSVDDMIQLNSIRLTSPIRCMQLSVDNIFLLIVLAMPRSSLAKLQSHFVGIDRFLNALNYHFPENYAGCDDASVGVYSFTTGTSVHQLSQHKSKVSSMMLSQDSHHAIIACVDGSVNVYNLRSTERLQHWNSHNSAVHSVSLVQNEYVFFTASEEKVLVWTMYKHSTYDSNTDNHSETVTMVTASPSGKLAVSGSEDFLVKVWNLDASDFSENLIGHKEPVTCVAIATDEAFIVSGSEDKTVKVWSVTLASIVTDYIEHGHTIQSVFVLSNNMQVLSVDTFGMMKIWKADNGHTLISCTGTSSLITIAPNGQFVICGGNQEAQIWQVTDGTVVQTITHVDEMTCVTCSDDSQYIATGSMDMSIKVWELSTGKLTQSISEEWTFPFLAMPCPQLARAEIDRSLNSLTINFQKTIQVLVEHDNSVTCVAITHNSQNVLSGSQDKSVIIWNLDMGTAEHRMYGHQESVTVIRATNDSSIAISGSMDGMLRVWSITHGKLITTFDMHSPVLDLSMSLDASRMAVHLQASCHVPLLCLHNTPASEIKSQSQITLQFLNNINGESQTLPVKPRPPLVNRASTVFPIPHRLKKQASEFSISSIPQIIQMSPIKAPIQSAMKCQEQNKEKKVPKQPAQSKSQSATTNQQLSSNEEPHPHRSNLCTML